jgi:peptide/nickel transport system permease protein
VVSILSAAMLAVPGFLVAMIGVAVFAVELGWFDPTGYTSPSGGGWWQWLRSITLPGFALGLPVAAVVARQLRSSMTNTLTAPFVLAARARGVPPRQLVRRHVLRSAMVPTVTVIGFQAAAVLGVTVAVEQVFAIPGMGTLLVQSITQRDLPVVQATLMLTALIVAVVNLTVDLSYGWLDPRVRLT